VSKSLHGHPPVFGNTPFEINSSIVWFPCDSTAFLFNLFLRNKHSNELTDSCRRVGLSPTRLSPRWLVDEMTGDPWFEIDNRPIHTMYSLSIQCAKNHYFNIRPDPSRPNPRVMHPIREQVLADHRRWQQLWRSPFPVTLQRIFNTCLKNCRFCCNFWTLQQKPHDYICSGRTFLR